MLKPIIDKAFAKSILGRTILRRPATGAVAGRCCTPEPALAGSSSVTGTAGGVRKFEGCAELDAGGTLVDMVYHNNCF